MRIELFSILYPVAYLNNPEFLEYMVPFTFSSALESSLKTYLPPEVDPHEQFHAKLLDLCRLKASIHYPLSFINNFQ